MRKRRIAKFVFTINVDDEIDKFTPEVAMVETELAEFDNKDEHDFAEAYYGLFRALAARMRKGVSLPALQDYVASLNGGYGCKRSCPTCHLDAEVVVNEGNNSFVCNFEKQTSTPASNREGVIGVLRKMLSEIDAEIQKTSDEVSEDGAKPDADIPDVFKNYIDNMDT